MSARHLGPRLSALLVGLGLLGLARTASAEPPLALTWAAPKDCPSKDSVTRAVERLITKPPAQGLVATVIVEEQDERYGAEIRTPRGERHLEGESCRAVSEAVAMVLALAIDPDASPSAAAFAAFDEPEPAPAPAKPSAPAKAPVVATASSPPPEDRAPPSEEPKVESEATARFVAAAFGLAEIGMLPQPTLGGALALGVAPTTWSAELSAMMLAPRSGDLENDSSRGGKIGYIGGHVAGCLSPVRSRRVDFCGSFEVGRLSGTGTGVTTPETSAALWLAPGLFGAARFPLTGHLHGEARLGAALALNRPKFSLDDLGQVHQPALLTLRGALGFSWR